jgi:hypothetical protein
MLASTNLPANNRMLGHGRYPMGATVTRGHCTVFQLAKAAYGDKAPEQYHGDLVPPARYALMRGFFAQALGGP